MKSLNARRRYTAAFTLVEVALALGVASFCLVAVMGLVPLGVSTGQMASDQTAAGSILTHVLADLRATPATVLGATTTTSTQYQIPIPANAGVGTSSTKTVLYFGDTAQQFSFANTLGTSRYRLTITFLPSAGGRESTGMNMMVSWPPQFDPSNTGNGAPTGRVQIFAALDRN